MEELRQAAANKKTMDQLLATTVPDRNDLGENQILDTKRQSKGVERYKVSDYDEKIGKRLASRGVNYKVDMSDDETDDFVLEDEGNESSDFDPEEEEDNEDDDDESDDDESEAMREAKKAKKAKEDVREI